MKTLLEDDLLSLSYCVVRVTVRTNGVPSWSGGWITGLAKKFVQIFLCNVMEKPEQTFWLTPCFGAQRGSNDGGDVAERGRVRWLAAPTRHFLQASQDTLMCSVWLSFPSCRRGIWSLSWSDNSGYRWAHAACMSGGGILTLHTLNQFIINTISAFFQGQNLIRVLWWQSQWNTVIDQRNGGSLMSLLFVL